MDSTHVMGLVPEITPPPWVLISDQNLYCFIECEHVYVQLGKSNCFKIWQIFEFRHEKGTRVCNHGISWISILENMSLFYPRVVTINCSLRACTILLMSLMLANSNKSHAIRYICVKIIPSRDDKNNKRLIEKKEVVHCYVYFISFWLFRTLFSMCKNLI